jgi:hypothetical protein
MARLIKTDIFKRLMWYVLPKSPPVPITVDRVKQLLAMNRRGQKPENLVSENATLSKIAANVPVAFHSGVGEIKLEELDPNIGKKKKKKKKKPDTKREPNEARANNTAPKDAEPKERKAKPVVKLNNNKGNADTPVE